MKRHEVRAQGKTRPLASGANLPVPHPCQNERYTAVTSSYPREPRTASDLAKGRQRPSRKTNF
jgi:hypothetical protein